jgi:putative hydrolase of the HAD superfamily
MPILFDLDDTLLDDRGAQDVYLAQLFDAYQTGLPYASQAEFRSAWRSAIDRHFARYLSGEISLAEQRRARIREVFGERRMAESRADAIVAEFLSAYEASWRLFPDVIETLDELNGTRLGIITNGNHEHQIKKLRSTGILDRFSVIVASESVGRAKPSREIFEHACAQLNCRPQDCAFVGDDWSRDIIGSAAVEMTPIWISRDERLVERDGVLAINSLTELTKRADVCFAIARHRTAS